MLKDVNKSWKRGSNFSDDENAFPFQKAFTNQSVNPHCIIQDTAEILRIY
jgi:hypothetical protein